MYKNFITCLLACMFVVNINNLSNASEVDFKDVSKESWYYNDLYKLYNQDIIAGFPDGTFGGQKTLTRDQFIKLVTVAVAPDGKYPKTSTYWAIPYIAKAKSLGILQYQSDDYSIYKENITREEMSYIIAKTIEYANGFATGNFKDVKEAEFEKSYEEAKNSIKDFDDIAEEYKETVVQVYNYGIINGFKDGTFKPNGILTRAEATAIISRLKSAYFKAKAKFNENITVDDEKRLKNIDNEDNVTELLPFLSAGTDISELPIGVEYISKITKEFVELNYGLNYLDVENNREKYEEKFFDYYPASKAIKTTDYTEFYTSTTKYINEILDTAIANENISYANFVTSPGLVYITKHNTIRVKGKIEYMYESTLDKTVELNKKYTKDVEIEYMYYENLNEIGISKCYFLD